ncbi:GNAT family N-acetyltransferase [Agaribacter marinus]|nr:GNAT family protein [Agaribacter marinus]
MLFESLNETHTDKLLAFELENREYFESFIASREETFYSLTGVSNHIQELQDLQQKSEAMSFVLMQEGCVIARANIKNIQLNGSAEIGYRVGIGASNRGIGSLCVNHLVCISENLNLKHLSAFVIDNNPASKKVLLKNGFHLDLCIPNSFEHQGQFYHGFEYLHILSQQPN